MASRKQKGGRRRSGAEARQAPPRAAPPTTPPAAPPPPRRPGLWRRARHGTDRWTSLIAVVLCLFGAWAASRVARQAYTLVQTDLPTSQLVVWWLVLAVTIVIGLLLVVQAIRSALRFWALRRGPAAGV